MKFLLYIVATILFVFSIPAVAGVADYTEQEIQNMPRYSSIEQQRCPKAKYPSVKKRLECKKEVRVEIYEKHKNENVQTTDQKE